MSVDGEPTKIWPFCTIRTGSCKIAPGLPANTGLDRTYVPPESFSKKKDTLYQKRGSVYLFGGVLSMFGLRATRKDYSEIC